MRLSSERSESGVDVSCGWEVDYMGWGGWMRGLDVKMDMCMVVVLALVAPFRRVGELEGPVRKIKSY